MTSPPPLHAETLRIHGPDALAFAHAVFTSDVHALQAGQWQWSAWLDAQGRVRCLFQILREAQTDLRLLLRGGCAVDVANALQPFVLRSRVDIIAQPAQVLLDAPASTDQHFWADAEGIQLGMGGYGMRMVATGTGTTSAPPPQAWRHHAIAAGHPWLPQAAIGKVLASSLPLLQLGAISMDKGCFPGQEIVARLHYRGGCKRHMRRIHTATYLEPGATLTQAGRPVGVVLDSAATAGAYEALAILHDAVTGPETILEIAAAPHVVHLCDSA